MKATHVSLALITAGLAACSSKADLPTIEQVAHAYEAHANANLSSANESRFGVGKTSPRIAPPVVPSGPRA